MTMITALGLQASLDDSLGTPSGTGDLRHKLQTCDCAVAKLEMLFQSMKCIYILPNKAQQWNTNPQNLTPILGFNKKTTFLVLKQFVLDCSASGKLVHVMLKEICTKYVSLETAKHKNARTPCCGIHSFQSSMKIHFPLLGAPSGSSQGVSGTLEGMTMPIQIQQAIC